MVTYIDENFFAAVDFASKQLKRLACDLVCRTSTREVEAIVASNLQGLEQQILHVYRVPLRFRVDYQRPYGEQITIKPFLDTLEF